MPIIEVKMISILHAIDQTLHSIDGKREQCDGPYRLSDSTHTHTRALISADLYRFFVLFKKPFKQKLVFIVLIFQFSNLAFRLYPLADRYIIFVEARIFKWSNPMWSMRERKKPSTIHFLSIGFKLIRIKVELDDWFILYFAIRMCMAFVQSIVCDCVPHPLNPYGIDRSSSEPKP